MAISDDPAVSVILSALKLTDHPGDTATMFHVEHRCSLADAIGLKSRDGAHIHVVAGRIRRALLADGYASVIAGWAKALAPDCDCSNFARLEQLIELAQQYDPQATLRPSDFVKFVEASQVEDTHPSSIRVMTINKAKGLEFDVVVLPQLNRTLCSDNDLRGEWVHAISIFTHRPD